MLVFDIERKIVGVTYPGGDLIKGRGGLSQVTEGRSKKYALKDITEGKVIIFQGGGTFLSAQIDAEYRQNNDGGSRFRTDTKESLYFGGEESPSDNDYEFHSMFKIEEVFNESFEELLSLLNEVKTV